MKLKIAGFIFLLLIPISAKGFELEMDKDASFPRASFAEFENAHSSSKADEGQGVVPVPGFSTEVIFSGKSRNLPEPKRKFLDSLMSREPTNREMFSLYQKEIEVQQEGKSKWIPVQRQLLSLMKKELKPGESIVLYIRYFERLDSESFYLVVHYSHDNVFPEKEKQNNL